MGSNLCRPQRIIRQTPDSTHVDTEGFSPASASRSSASHGRAVANFAGQDQGGQAGFHWFDDGDGNMYVAHAAFLGNYFGGSFAVTTPPSGVSQSILDAPTSHAGGNDCIEAVTSYSDGFAWPGYTKGQLQVFDFCIGNFATTQWPIDSAFMDNYVRVWSNSGDGIPKYILETENVHASDGYFHLIIYNANTGNWDDFYDANSGLSNSRTDGWSLFETHFGARDDITVEACPNIGTISETGLRLHNSSGWYAVSSSDASSPGSYGECFSAPSAPHDFPPYSYSYTFNYNFANDSMWSVTTN